MTLGSSLESRLSPLLLAILDDTMAHNEELKQGERDDVSTRQPRYIYNWQSIRLRFHYYLS